MDPATLTTFLAPFLPTLMKLGGKILEGAAAKSGETAGTKLTEQALNKASAIWEKLLPKVQAKEAAKEAAEDVAKAPDDADAQAALRLQFKKILEREPSLAEAIAKIMKEDAPDGTLGTQIVQNVTGNQNQVIGQVTGGQVFGNVSGRVMTGGTVNLGTAPATADLAAKDKDTPSPVKTILVLAANPKGTNPLRLGEEVRRIQAGLERSQYRSRFRIEQRWAATQIDVRRALLDCKPQIIHFSGHGVGQESGDASSTRKMTVISNSATEPEGLMFEDETGQIKLVSGDAIANLFALFSDQIEFVVLNACYSEAQANAIGQHIPYVVGMKRAIGDRAAIEFAVGFYDAILAGQSVDFAYKLGCNAILMEGIPEHLTPTIHRKPV